MTLLLTLAFAHHGTGTTQVSPPSLPTLQQEPSADGLAGQVGLRYDLTRIDRRVDGTEREAAESPVSMHRASVHGALRLPGQRSVGLAMPVGLVHSDASDRLGAGDLALWVGQAVGRRLRLQLEGGLTAPTGTYDREAAHSELELQGLDDGQLLMATYDTRTSLGAGSWSAQARGTVQVPLGPAAARVHGTLSQPLTRTPDGYRWGRDTLAGGTLVSPALGPVTLEAGADRRWHQTDRFAFVDQDDGSLLEQPVGRRQQTALTAALTLAVSDRTSCRIDGYRLVGQQADGIQLMASMGGGMGCQLSIPARTQAPTPARTADLHEADASSTEDAPVDLAPTEQPSR